MTTPSPLQTNAAQNFVIGINLFSLAKCDVQGKRHIKYNVLNPDTNSKPKTETKALKSNAFNLDPESYKP